MTPRKIPGVFAIAMATPGAFAGEHIATPPRTSAAMFAAMPTRETS